MRARTVSIVCSGGCTEVIRSNVVRFQPAVVRTSGLLSTQRPFSRIAYTRCRNVRRPVWKWSGRVNIVRITYSVLSPGVAGAIWKIVARVSATALSPAQTKPPPGRRASIVSVRLPTTVAFS